MEFSTSWNLRKHAVVRMMSTARRARRELEFRGQKGSKTYQELPESCMDQSTSMLRHQRLRWISEGKQTSQNARADVELMAHPEALELVQEGCTGQRNAGAYSQLC